MLVLELHHLVGVGAVVAAEQEDEVGAEPHGGRGCGDGGPRHLGELGPADAAVVAPSVGQIAAPRLAVVTDDELGAAEQIEAPAPRRGDRQDTGRAGTGLELEPGGRLVGEAERPEVLERRGRLRGLLAAGDEDRLADQGGAHHRARPGQRRQRGCTDLAFQPGQQQALGVAPLGVAAPEQVGAVLRGDGGAVGEGPRELEARVPGGLAGLEDEDAVRPDLRAALEERDGEVGAARHDQRPVARAREGAAEAQRLRQRRQLLPAQRADRLPPRVALGEPRSLLRLLLRAPRKAEGEQAGWEPGRVSHERLLRCASSRRARRAPCAGRRRWRAGGRRRACGA